MPRITSPALAALALVTLARRTGARRGLGAYAR